MSSLTLPTSGGLRNGALFERPMPEHLTSAPDYSSLPTLPTPAVNDMGRGKTPDEWDAWTAKMQAAHGNGNGHGKSLEIEAQRLLPTPTSQAAKHGATPDRTANAHGHNLWDVPLLVAGGTMSPQSDDGKPSSADPLHQQPIPGLDSLLRSSSG